MKKFLWFLLILVATVAVISGMATPVTVPAGEGTQMKVVIPFSSFEKEAPIVNPPETASPPATATSSVEETTAEQSYHSDEIPLTYEQQSWLQAACEEFDIPYALALGLIEKESTFRNVMGDDGASAGYMQIQQKWHWDRMERLGVTDLMEASGNFRVGCDFLSELYGRYQNWSLALTVYNMGHDPGYITDYAKDVMKNYANWQKTLEPYG